MPIGMPGCLGVLLATVAAWEALSRRVREPGTAILHPVPEQRVVLRAP